MDNNINSNSEEISLKELILKLRSAFIYLKSKWLIIMLCGVLGGALGFLYATIKKPIYTATSTFVLEDSKVGGLSQYAGLASIAGIDLGGNAGGIFQGDNILELFKSRLMIEKTLLSSISLNGRNELLIDRYIDYNNLKRQWKDHINLISFLGDPSKFDRTQDSIILDIVTIFNKKNLNVIKPDKKLNIIQVDVTTNNEMFSKYFNDKLVENVTDFYIQTKTKKSFQNVMLLQRQADSIKKVLNFSISGVAAASDNTPNANPNQLILKVPSQRKQVDVQTSMEIYGEVVKNLEISKISLRQETPLIQLIDRPMLPLPIVHTGKFKGATIGFFIGGLLNILFLTVRKLYIKVMK